MKYGFLLRKNSAKQENTEIIAKQENEALVRSLKYFDFRRELLRKKRTRVVKKLLSSKKTRMKSFAQIHQYFVSTYSKSVRKQSNKSSQKTFAEQEFGDWSWICLAFF